MAKNSARKDDKPPFSDSAALVAGNVRIHGRRTSVRLESEMWSALYEIAKIEDISIHEVCSAVDDGKLHEESFSSALRVFLLQYFRDVARGKRRDLKLEMNPPERTGTSARAQAD